MPSNFPRSPRFLKGALVAYETPFLGVVPNIIVFQYNPEKLSRTLTDQSTGADAKRKGVAREETLVVKGPPTETISLTVELDAADQLDEPELHPHLAAKGLHPALAALELLLYPRQSQILFNQTLSKAGKVQITAEKVPLVLFVWGPSRVLPVRLTSFQVTEKAFDQQLNPIQAEVQLSLRVLTYLDFKENNLGFIAYMATQVQKEVLARLNLLSSIEQSAGMVPF